MWLGNLQQAVSNFSLVKAYSLIFNSSRDRISFMTSEMSNPVPTDEALRTQRVAFAIGVRQIAPTIILADEIWKGIMGEYTENQQEIFFSVVSDYASVMRFGKTAGEIDGDFVIQTPTGEECYTNLADAVSRSRLVDANMPDITIGMVQSVADMLLGASFSLRSELTEQEFGESEEFE